MTAALLPTDYATASTFLKGATKLYLRQRPLLGFLDEEGRISRGFEGKDLNWDLDYKLPTATGYVPQQPLSFANDNYLLKCSVTPEWSIATSGMDITEVLMNSGSTAIVNNLGERGPKLFQSVQVKISTDLYSDSVTNPGAIIGLNTFARRNITDKVCTNADRLSVPLSGVRYAGLQLQPAAYGGGWSNVIPNAQQMSTVLGSDWPDGQATPDQMYDATTPRLYNENTNQWASPGTAPAAGTWRTNCLSMLSRANTDLNMNTVKEMMPNVHMTGSGRLQDVKENLKTAFRDTQMSNKAAEMLGYYNGYAYEGAAIMTDNACPADRTFSICAATMDLHFYSTAPESGAKVVDGAQGGAMVTGGIFTWWGPTLLPGTLGYAWVVLCGGFARYNPKWIVIHKDFTSAGGAI